MSFNLPKQLDFANLTAIADPQIRWALEYLYNVLDEYLRFNWDQANTTNTEVVELAGYVDTLDIGSVLRVGSAAGDINAGITEVDGGKISANSISLSQLDFSPVGSDNVIGSINASSESVIISADRLELNGVLEIISDVSVEASEASGSASNALTVANNALSGANTANTNINALSTVLGALTVLEGDTTYINGGMIKTGTLLANEIGAGTLGVNVVYAGNVSASKITAGTLNCENVTVKNLTVSGIFTIDSEGSAAMADSAVDTDHIVSGAVNTIVEASDFDFVYQSLPTCYYTDSTLRAGDWYSAINLVLHNETTSRKFYIYQFFATNDTDMDLLYTYISGSSYLFADKSIDDVCVLTGNDGGYGYFRLYSPSGNFDITGLLSSYDFMTIQGSGFNVTIHKDMVYSIAVSSYGGYISTVIRLNMNLLGGQSCNTGVSIERYTGGVYLTKNHGENFYILEDSSVCIDTLEKVTDAAGCYTVITCDHTGAGYLATAKFTHRLWCPKR